MVRSTVLFEHSSFAISSSSGMGRRRDERMTWSWKIRSNLSTYSYFCLRRAYIRLQWQGRQRVGSPLERNPVPKCVTGSRGGVRPSLKRVADLAVGRHDRAALLERRDETVDLALLELLQEQCVDRTSECLDPA